jgi:hypothetical protein
MSWKRLTLFEEGAVGLIEGLRFESPTQGTAAVDRGRPGPGRYATLESSNAGDTWTVLETSAARPRPLAAAAAPDWRISVDVASKSFRIERREGSAWHKAAAFAVAAGACRPEPRPAAVEPPPPGQLHY